MSPTQLLALKWILADFHCAQALFEQYKKSRPSNMLVDGFTHLDAGVRQLEEVIKEMEDALRVQERTTNLN